MKGEIEYNKYIERITAFKEDAIYNSNVATSIEEKQIFTQRIITCDKSLSLAKSKFM